MKTIATINMGTPDAPILEPAEPIPAEAIAVVCDGVNYLVYEPGDTVPTQPQ